MLPVAITPYLDPSQWTHGDWVEIREWMIALGTVGATILALLLALGLQGWIARPKLKLGDGSLSVLGRIGAPIVTARFPVANEGKSAALNVRVTLLSTEVWSDERSRWEGLNPQLSGRTFPWSNTAERTADLAPHSAREFDLFEITRDWNNQGRMPIRLPLSPAAGDAATLDPKSWCLEIELGAVNAPVRRFFIAVCYRGWWPRPDVLDTIAITTPSEKRPAAPPAATGRNTRRGTRCRPRG